MEIQTVSKGDKEYEQYFIDNFEGKKPCKYNLPMRRNAQWLCRNIAVQSFAGDLCVKCYDDRAQKIKRSYV